jgi:competence protein ComEC
MLNWKEVPFVRLLIPLLLGILAATLWPKPLPLFWLLLFVPVLFSTLFRPPFATRWLHGAFVQIFLLVLGHQLFVINSNPECQALHYSHHINKEGNTLIALVDEPATNSPYSVKIVAKVRGIGPADGQGMLEATGKSIVYLPLDTASVKLNYGDLLLIRCRIVPVTVAGNPNSFDFKQYLHYKNIDYKLNTSENDWALLKSNEGSWLHSRAYSAQARLFNILKAHLKNNDDELGVAAALILGYREGLSDGIIDAYAGTGAMHVLAVSGLHVGIISLILLQLLKYVTIQKRWWAWAKAVLLLACIWGFALVTGASPSVLRAAVMFSFLTLGQTLGRHSNPYNALAASAFLLLCYDPLMLFSVGFQLSYLAMLGIFYFHPKIYRLWPIENTFGDKLWEISALGIAAQLATLPISLYYFHQFPTYFWLTGPIVVYAAMVILSLGLALLFFEIFLPDIAEVCGNMLYATTYLMNSLVSMVNKFPGHLITGIWVTMGMVALAYIGLMFAAFSINSKQGKWLLASLASFLAMAISYDRAYLENRQKGVLTVYQQPRKSLVDFKEGGDCLSLQSQYITPKDIAFSAENHRWSMGLKQVEAFPIDTSRLVRNFFYKNNNYIQYKDRRLLIFDKLYKMPQSGRLQLDHILVINNPRLNIEEITQRFGFKNIIFDSSNFPSNIAAWKKACIESGLEFYDISESGAWVLDASQQSPTQ